MWIKLNSFLKNLTKLRHRARESLFKTSRLYALLNRITIVNDGLFRNKAKTTRILLSNNLQNRNHLIRITDNIGFAISILFHFRTWRKWKT